MLIIAIIWNSALFLRLFVCLYVKKNIKILFNLKKSMTFVTPNVTNERL